MLKRWAAAIALLLAVPMATTAGASDGAQAGKDFDFAATCYGGQEPLLIESRGTSETFTTSERCNDINVRPLPWRDADLVVCFYPQSGGTDCGDWDTATANRWNVIATNVLPGTEFTVSNGSYHDFEGWVAA